MFGREDIDYFFHANPVIAGIITFIGLIVGFFRGEGWLTD